MDYFKSSRAWIFRIFIILFSSILLQYCKSLAPTEQTKTFPLPPAENIMGNVIPMPVSVKPADGFFTLNSGLIIFVDPYNDELLSIGQFFADKLNLSTGLNIQVKPSLQVPAASIGNILLTTVSGDPALGNEGYLLNITKETIKLSAYKAEGLFRGIQTLRQLLPADIEKQSLQSGPFKIAAGTIQDYPRFEWRGVMLDVSRHFFKVQDVKRYIDLIAYYKMNRFHLHLSDDQGWRIQVNSRPRLTEIGGSTQVGGGPGGYFTQNDYTDIVNYAKQRYITIIPEIDMPGHSNAALASYSELNSNGIATQLYTGTNVGFSSLNINIPATTVFLKDVIRELSAITPGPYIHIGGDEAAATAKADYIKFMDTAQAIVQQYGKQVIGWEEIAQARMDPNSIAQHWTGEFSLQAVNQGAKIIMSPNSKTYLDMKYNNSIELGFDWAGLIEVETSYNWDPVLIKSGIREANILGIEAPLWSETLNTIADIEFMAFPRVPGLAEVGWSPAFGRDWNEYKFRLGTHGSRLQNMGVNFYQSSQVPWR